MYNWSSQEQIDKKRMHSDDDYRIWRLEQAINFGLNKELLNKKEVKKYWQKLTLDPHKKKFLSYLIWNKLS